MAVEKKPRGRPAKAEADRKRHTMSFRATDDLRDKIMAAAAVNSRSASEEAEYRLHASFSDTTLDLMGAAGTREFSLMLAVTANMLEKATGKSIWNDDRTRQMVRASLLKQIDLFLAPDPADEVDVQAVQDGQRDGLDAVRAAMVARLREKERQAPKGVLDLA